MTSNEAAPGAAPPQAAPPPVSFRWKLALAGLMAGYLAFFITLEYHRYTCLELFDANDTAANIQTVWSLAHPPVFTTTVQEYLKPVPHNVLGDQLYFTLALYLPFTLVFGSPFTFVVVTLAALAAGALPLFGLARVKGLPEAAAFTVAALFLFNPFVTNSFFRFGFRPECLAIPFLLAAWYFLELRKYPAAQLFLILVLLTKHDSVILLAGLGLVLAVFRPGLRCFGALNLALALAYYLLVVRPLFAHFGYSETAYFKTLAPLGDTPASALLNLVLHPGRFLELVSPGETRLLLLLPASVGFLCLLSPLFLAVLPFVVINLVGNDYHSIISGWHWTMAAPVVGLAAVEGLARVRSLMQGRRWRAAAMAAAAVALLVDGEWTAQAVLDQRYFPAVQQGIDTAGIIAACRSVPPQASVATTYRLLWFFASRRQVYYNCDRMVLDVEYMVIPRPLEAEEDMAANVKMYEAVLDQDSALYTRFDRIYSDERVTILKRKPTAQ